MVLFTDATIVTETPPLRACWGMIGHQVEVPITGNRNKRVIFGTLNPKTGHICLDVSLKWNQDGFQSHLRHIRSLWRGWRIVLFLDRGSPHRAKRSVRLAKELGIQLRWLPVACPKLNPLEGLWREVKGRVLANEPTPDIDVSVSRACQYLVEMSREERLRKAGCLSENFWIFT